LALRKQRLAASQFLFRGAPFGDFDREGGICVDQLGGALRDSVFEGVACPLQRRRDLSRKVGEDRPPSGRP